MNDEKMKAILADDIPIVIGFSIFQPEFESDETKKTGKIALPPPNTNLPFSHAVLCVGFDDNEVNRDGSRGAWIFRNSRGPEWGNKGLGTLPYKYPRLPEQWVVYKFSSVSI
jgi:C1A family cysteine protease